MTIEIRKSDIDGNVCTMQFSDIQTMNNFLRSYLRDFLVQIRSELERIDTDVKSEIQRINEVLRYIK